MGGKNSGTTGNHAAKGNCTNHGNYAPVRKQFPAAAYEKIAIPVPQEWGDQLRKQAYSVELSVTAYLRQIVQAHLEAVQNVS